MFMRRQIDVGAASAASLIVTGAAGVGRAVWFPIHVANQAGRLLA
jgi:hypothetical protein